MEEQKKTDNKTVEQNSTPKKKYDIKKALRNITALALVAVISIVLTLAFLNRTSERKTNTFTGADGIKLDLEEPNFNDNGNGGPKWADKPNPYKYNPGSTYEKDPTLYNISGTDGANEWVAIRIDYRLNNLEVNYSTLIATSSAVATTSMGAICPIEFNTEYWVQLDKSEIGIDNANFDIWVYKYPLKGTADIDTVDECNTECTTFLSGEKTKPLFSEVKTLSQKQLEDNGYDVNEKLPDFKIMVIGGAINIPQEYASLNVFPATAQNRTAAANASANAVMKALVDLLKDKTPTS